MIAASTLGNPPVLALFAAFMFGLALVLTQFGLRYASPLHGALVSIPTAAAFLWMPAPLLLDWRNLSPAPTVIFAAVGLFFPATVTLLTFEANRQMGPGVSGAASSPDRDFTAVDVTVLHGESRPPESLFDFVEGDHRTCNGQGASGRTP